MIMFSSSSPTHRPLCFPSTQKPACHRTYALMRQVGWEDFEDKDDNSESDEEEEDVVDLVKEEEAEEVEIKVDAEDVTEDVEFVRSGEAPREGRGLIGQRVRVYWDADDAWYAGTIREYSRSRGHYIVFDRAAGENHLEQQDFQWCKLEEEVWQIIGSMPLSAYE